MEYPFVIVPMSNKGPKSKDENGSLIFDENMDLFLLLLRRIRILFESNVQEIIPKRMLMEKEKYGIPIRKMSSNLFFLSF